MHNSSVKDTMISVVNSNRVTVKNVTFYDSILHKGVGHIESSLEVAIEKIQVNRTKLN